MELTLLDVSLLERSNQLQYTFVDKENRKVVYREPFKMVVRFHPNHNILEKDYFEPFDNLIEYEYRNIWDFNQFKRALNQVFLNALKV